LLESKTASFLRAGIQNCIISACWNPKLHQFRLLESTGIVSTCYNPKLHHFLLLEYKTASFLLAGIQNCIVSCAAKAIFYCPAAIAQGPKIQQKNKL
jgi:hypothetical protein